jgi:CheY-like chemotaxis protein
MVARLEVIADVLAPTVERSPGADRTACWSATRTGWRPAGSPASSSSTRARGASVAHDAGSSARRRGGKPPDLVICDDWMEGLRVDEVARRLREAVDRRAAARRVLARRAGERPRVAARGAPRATSPGATP